MSREPEGPAHRFAQLAERYCAWAEHAPASNEQEAVTARELLAELYSLALTLPDGMADPEVDAPRIDDAVWKRMYERFGTLPIRYYAVVADPSVVPPEEAVVGDASDDLADIYRDLRAGLDLYRAGLLPNAVWEWRFHFEVHWGAHALGCLVALHAYNPTVASRGAA